MSAAWSWEKSSFKAGADPIENLEMARLYIDEEIERIKRGRASVQSIIEPLIEKSPKKDHVGVIPMNNMPFEKMAVGDSFFCLCSKEQIKRVRGQVSGNGSYFGRKHGMKFATRTYSTGTTGVRCWRVS